MNIILFGPPGAGKGTQAQFIVKKHNYFQLSTGNLLRNEVKLNTELGSEIEELISNGKFVSDEIVNKLLKQSITNLKFRDRIIFDGYPRNVEQAINLEIILNEFNQSIGHTISLSKLKVMLTTDTPGEDSDLIDSIPGVVLTAFSIMFVILESIISGFAPLREVVTDRMGNSTIGNLSIPIF